MKRFQQLRPLHNNTKKLDPWFVTKSGFTDGEGCFLINVKASGSQRNNGYGVELVFRLHLHSRDRAFFPPLPNPDRVRSTPACLRMSSGLGWEEKILSLGSSARDFFGSFYLQRGRLTAVSENYVQYWVGALEDILVIVNHFDKYPLITQKWSDYQLFKGALELVVRKEHLTPSPAGLLSLAPPVEGWAPSLATKGGPKEPPSLATRKIKNSLSVSISTPGNKRHYSTTINKGDQTKFNQWLGGLIDGDGQFHTTKKGISSLKIVMHINDKSLLYSIKHKYGGFIKEIAGSNALKYKLQAGACLRPKGLINLINDVNGLIRNPIRMLQLNRICVKYNIKLIVHQRLTNDNDWFSVLVDSDGSISIDEKSGQLTISVTQKNRYLLEPLQKLYGGKIYIISSKGEVFKYTIFRKEEVLNLVDVYFQIFPLKSSKASKINLIKDFYLLQPHRNLDVNKIDKFNQWIQFKSKWDKIV